MNIGGEIKEGPVDRKPCGPVTHTPFRRPDPEDGVWRGPETEQVLTPSTLNKKKPEEGKK